MSHSPLLCDSAGSACQDGPAFLKRWALAPVQLCCSGAPCGAAEHPCGARQGPHPVSVGRGVLNSGRRRGLTEVSPVLLAISPSPDRLGQCGRLITPRREGNVTRNHPSQQSSTEWGRKEAQGDRLGLWARAASRDPQACGEKMRRLNVIHSATMCFNILSIITIVTF